MNSEELEFAVQQHRQWASSFNSFTSTGLGSPVSTDVRSSSPVSSWSQADDASDHWADICDIDDELELPLPSPPSRPAGTWFLPPACGPLETQMATEERAAVEAKSAPAERTTLMIRNLPNGLTRCMLLNLLNQHGFEGCYDFVDLPVDFRTFRGKGFAFVNMVSAQSAELLRIQFTGFSGWPLQSCKVAEVIWSSHNHSLAEHVERYRNSAVMHESVPDDFKPVLFRNGVRVEFPPPTQQLRAP